MKFTDRLEIGGVGPATASASVLVGGLLLATLGLRSPGAVEAFQPPAARDLADLEPVVVEVRGGGDFRVGGQGVSTDGELLALLKRLARAGEPATVEMADDARFDETMAAVRACERAGFATVAIQAGSGRD